MSTQDHIKVAGIKVYTDKPTNVAMHRLYGWVIWQFPQPQKKGYQGAVRPPEEGQEWIPALIQADENRVRLFGNAEETYPTPEKAVKFFNESSETA